MVSVRMSDQDSIEPFHPVTQHLLPEVRSDIELYMLPFVGT